MCGSPGISTWSGQSPDKTTPFETLLPSQRRKTLNSRKWGPPRNTLLCFSRLWLLPLIGFSLSQTPGLEKGRPTNSLLPSTGSARMQAGCAVGPQSVKGLSSAGRALMFRIEWYLQDMDPRYGSGCFPRHSGNAKR